MKTLIVDIKANGNANAIAEALRLMKGVGKVSISDDTPRKMSLEEFNAMIDESLEDARQGHITSQKDFEKEMTKW